jgi:hypothetical protein
MDSAMIVLIRILVVLTVIVVGAFVVRLFLTKEKRALGDYVSILSLIASVAAVVVAVVALAEANSSGAEQAKLLGDQKIILNTASSTLIKSNDALQKSLGYAKQTIQTLKTSTDQQSRILTASGSALRQQSTLLNASSTALQQEVATANAQQRALAESLSISRQQLALVRSQYEAQLSLQQARRRIEFALGQGGWNSGSKPMPCVFPVTASPWTRTAFLIRNVGNSTLTHVVINLLALPPTVAVAGDGSTTPDPTNPDAVQTDGKDIEPVVTFKYLVNVETNNASEIWFTIQTSGENSITNSAPTLFKAVFHCYVVPAG